MTRLALIALTALPLLGGCDKPKPEDCRKALINMQHLLGTENLNDTASLEGEVRRCRGGSKRKAVECAIKAQTIDELRACDFYQLPDKATKGPAPGSSAGSAASAPAGANGPAMSPPGGAPPSGSAAPALAGSNGPAMSPPGGTPPSGSAAAAPAGSAAAASAGSAAAASAGSAK
jgi:hypothetical protein